MRIFFILDETRFHQSKFVADFLSKTSDDVVGAGLVTKIPPKNCLKTYLKKNWHFLKISEILKLVILENITAFTDVFGKKEKNKPFGSVKSALMFFNIPIIEIKNNINQAAYVDHIKSLEPDVIISSNSLYFKEDILNIPKICCINRHSSLLPSYGGVWPVMWAFLNEEPFAGVSVHIMEKAIDKGPVLAQETIPLPKKIILNDFYNKCFDVSAEVVLKALDKIRVGDFTSCSQYRASYHSFPKKKDWNKFRQMGGRFI